MFVVRSHGTSALKIAVRNLPFESREPELGRFIWPAVYFFVYFFMIFYYVGIRKCLVSMNDLICCF